MQKLIHMRYKYTRYKYERVKNDNLHPNMKVTKQKLSVLLVIFIKILININWKK